jgi:hypothetical protein
VGGVASGFPQLIECRQRPVDWSASQVQETQGMLVKETEEPLAMMDAGVYVLIAAH